MLVTGNSTNGLPYFLQGAYWQDGLQWDEVRAAGPPSFMNKIVAIRRFVACWLEAEFVQYLFPDTSSDPALAKSYMAGKASLKIATLFKAWLLIVIPVLLRFCRLVPQFPGPYTSKWLHLRFSKPMLLLPPIKLRLLLLYFILSGGKVMAEPVWWCRYSLGVLNSARTLSRPFRFAGADDNLWAVRSKDEGAYDRGMEAQSLGGS